ncbi:MAG: hypothetical protein U1E77_01615 [Inhella sp.]
MWKSPHCQRRQLLFALTGGLAGSAARADSLRVFADEDYYPLIHRQAERPAGLLVERLQRSSAFSGDQFVIELVGLNRALMLAEQARAVCSAYAGAGALAGFLGAADARRHCRGGAPRPGLPLSRPARPVRQDHRPPRALVTRWSKPSSGDLVERTPGAVCMLLAGRLTRQ